jgi:hypothetical protein
MRKGVSILFALVVIISSAHLTIATHYCGGEVAARKISFSGKLATCGMENSKESCPSSEKQLKTHCCENRVVTIGIVNNFITPVSIQKADNQNIQDLCSFPVNHFYHFISGFNQSFTNIHPPGGYSATAVDLNNICAFRI